MKKQKSKRKNTMFLFPMGIGIICIAIIISVVVFMAPKSAKAGKLQEKLDLGSKYLETADYAKAEVAFNEALKIDEKSPDAAVGLAEVYNKQKKPEKALTMLKKASENLSANSVKKNPQLWQQKMSAYSQVYDDTSKLFTDSGNTVAAAETKRGKEQFNIYIVKIIAEETESAEQIGIENETDDSELSLEPEVPDEPEIMIDPELSPDPNDEEIPGQEVSPDPELSPDPNDEDIPDSEVLPDPELSPIPNDEENPYSEVAPQVSPEPDGETIWNTDSPSEPDGETASDTDSPPESDGETASDADSPSEPDGEATSDTYQTDNADPMETDSEVQVSPTEILKNYANNVLLSENPYSTAAGSPSSYDYSNAQASVSIWNGTAGMYCGDLNGDGVEELLSISIVSGKLSFEIYRVDNGNVVSCSSGIAEEGFANAAANVSYAGTQECFIKDNGDSVYVGLAENYYGADAGDGNASAYTAVNVFEIGGGGSATLICSASIINGSGVDSFMGNLAGCGMSGSWISDAAASLAAMDLENNPNQDMTGVTDPLRSGIASAEGGVQDLVIVNADMAAGSAQMTCNIRDNTTFLN